MPKFSVNISKRYVRSRINNEIRRIGVLIEKYLFSSSVWIGFLVLLTVLSLIGAASTNAIKYDSIINFIKNNPYNIIIGFVVLFLILISAAAATDKNDADESKKSKSGLPFLGRRDKQRVYGVLGWSTVLLVYLVSIYILLWLAGIFGLYLTSFLTAVIVSLVILLHCGQRFAAGLVGGLAGSGLPEALDQASGVLAISTDFLINFSSNITDVSTSYGPDPEGTFFGAVAIFWIVTGFLTLIISLMK